MIQPMIKTGTKFAIQNGRPIQQRKSLIQSSTNPNRHSAIIAIIFIMKPPFDLSGDVKKSIISYIYIILHFNILCQFNNKKAATQLCIRLPILLELPEKANRNRDEPPPEPQVSNKCDEDARLCKQLDETEVIIRESTHTTTDAKSHCQSKQIADKANLLEQLVRREHKESCDSQDNQINHKVILPLK